MRVVNNILKRLFDVVFSLLGLVISSPLFLYIVIRVKLDSEGSVIYRGKRMGRHGKAIGVYKFRTM